MPRSQSRWHSCAKFLCEFIQYDFVLFYHACTWCGNGAGTMQMVIGNNDDEFYLCIKHNSPHGNKNWLEK